MFLRSNGLTISCKRCIVLLDRNDLRAPVSEPRFQRAFLASHFHQRGIELYKRAFHGRFLRVTLYTRGSSITSQRGRNLC